MGPADQPAGRAAARCAAQPEQAAELLLRRLRPEGRRPGREPHLHLLGERGETPGRPTTGSTRGDARDARRACSTAACAAAPCTSCRSAWARSARRSPPSASRSPTRLRRRLDAGHDPHGRAGAGRDGRGRLLRPGRALRRRAAAAGPGRTCRGRATRPSTSSTSPRPGRSGPTAPGYGGNALLGKKCYALRIASVMARDEGWLAEHMLILKLTSPEGDGQVHRRRLPDRVRQDQPGHAAADASPAGRPRPSATTSAGCASATDGRLYAINPEAGFFGVAPGTGESTNKNAIDTL